MTFVLFLVSNTAFSQTGTAVTMTIQNAVQTSASVFEYDVMLTNTGSTTVALRGYSCGINHATGMNAGGTITHTFVSRDPSLATIPVVSPGYTAASNHLRLTTVNATTGNEVVIPVGTPVRLATMRVTNTVSFPANFNPAFALQTLTAAGKTQCVVTAIITPPGSSYAINGPGNNPIAGTLQALTGVVNMPCFFLNPSSVFAATKTSSTPILCYGQSTGTAVITLSGTGSSSTGTYKINGGSDINYTSNPFNVSGLAAGSNIITVTSASGCVDTALVALSQPAGSSSATACNTYTWTGTTYTVSGVYTKTFSLSAGCDSIHTLTLTIKNSSTGSNNVIACNSYTWNGTTYNVSGNYTHTYINAVGCDSVHTLHLTINPSTSSITTITAANSYTWNANNVTYTTSGTYTFTMLNANGCDSNLTLNLSIITISVSADQDISCFGANDGTVFAHATGSGTFTYDLDGANLFTNVTGYFFNLAPGSHTVCAKQATTNVTVCGTAIINEPLPLTATFTVDSVATCVGNHGQLSINISGGTVNNQPYLTLWKNSAGDTLNNQLTDNYATTVGSLAAGTYFVRVEDDHACVINVSTTLAPPVCDVSLNLRLFIQGYYTSASTMTPTLMNESVGSNPNITDTIIVERHASTFPYGVIDSKKTLLLTDGTATCTFLPSATSSYIVIKHRNALETWSSNPVSFASGTISYDFSDLASKAYGNNMKEMQTGVWALYSGDLNSDENIDLLDLLIVEDAIGLFAFGYEPADINGDGNVDLLDLPALEDNIGNFVFSQHP